LGKQKERDQRIYSKLHLDKLHRKLTYNHFKELGSAISQFIKYTYNLRKKSKELTWCFANEKNNKIFFQIFHANEEGLEIYKEEISKNIPEYSYKTIAKIIDEGILKGYYIPLEVDGTPGRDGKVKNIRPSEQLIIDFLNYCLEISHAFDLMLKNDKTIS